MKLAGYIGFDGYALCCLFLHHRNDLDLALNGKVAMPSDRSGAAQQMAFSFSFSRTH